jgi:hypothetical protein
MGRTVKALCAWLALLFLVGAACTTPVPVESTAAVEQAVGEEFCHDGRGDPPLKITWLTPINIPQATSTLALRLESPAEDVTVDLDLFAQGLDQRQILRSQATRLAVGPRSTIDVTIRLADMPVQSMSFASLGSAKATVTRVDGTVLTMFAPYFYYHYTDSYSQAWIYDFVNLVGRENGGQLTEDAFNLVGQIWKNGAFVEINRARQDEYPGEQIPRASGPIFKYNWPGPPGQEPPPSSGYKICADWTSQFYDAGHGEDVANTQECQFIRASYARAIAARVTSFPCAADSPASPCVSVVSDGYLDADGCFWVQNPTYNATYVLWMYAEFKKGQAAAHVDYYTSDSPATNAGIQSSRMSFFMPLPGSILPPPMPKSPLHPAVNAAAVTSLVLKAPQLITSGSVTVNAGLSCPTIPGDACAIAPALYAGTWTNSQGHAGDLQSKYVIGHELGHVMQHFGSGIPAANYSATPSNNDARCKCDHVTNANQIHCMGSLEHASAAQVEAWAHFTAARLFNDPAGNDCKFNYYKDYIDGSSAVHKAPYSVDCRNAVKWRNHYCYQQERGTEHDWLQFFWNVDTVGTATSSIQELYDIYKIACGGSNCTLANNVLWSDLAVAAQTKYGPLSDKNQQFSSYGDLFSVNNNSAL